MGALASFLAQSPTPSPTPATTGWPLLLLMGAGAVAVGGLSLWYLYRRFWRDLSDEEWPDRPDRR